MLRMYLALCFLLAPLSALADGSTDLARSVIEDQIAAFLNDDAAAAYSFASPQIRAKFPDQAVFFDMVRKNYAPVYRPGNFTFGRNKIDGDKIVQEVIISGADGKTWTALYLIERQPDCSYKINGVQMLQQAPGKEI